MKFIPCPPNVLQVDIDRPGAALNERVFEQIASTVGIKQALMAPSRNGNTHWTITLARRLPLMERLLLACALGDDPVRTALGWRRARGRKPRPVVFFEKDGKNA